MNARIGHPPRSRARNRNPRDVRLSPHTGRLNPLRQIGRLRRKRDRKINRITIRIARLRSSDARKMKSAALLSAVLKKRSRKTTSPGSDSACP